MRNRWHAANPIGRILVYVAIGLLVLALVQVAF